MGARKKIFPSGPEPAIGGLGHKLTAFTHCCVCDVKGMRTEHKVGWVRLCCVRRVLLAIAGECLKSV
jgi:hypothetical protein